MRCRIPALIPAWLEVIDQRHQVGGGLWIIGGDEVEPYLRYLQAEFCVSFHHSLEGGKPTGNRSAWWTIDKDPRLEPVADFGELMQ